MASVERRAWLCQDYGEPYLTFDPKRQLGALKILGSAIVSVEKGVFARRTDDPEFRGRAIRRLWARKRKADPNFDPWFG